MSDRADLSACMKAADGRATVLDRLKNLLCPEPLSAEMFRPTDRRETNFSELRNKSARHHD
jgi:hypothetical protein